MTKICVFSTCFCFVIDSRSEEDFAGKINIKELRWDADKQCDIYRKLYNETHGIYLFIYLSCRTNHVCFK